MGRKLAVYAFSLSAVLALTAGAVVARYRAASLARSANEDPRLLPAGSLFSSRAEVRFALLAPAGRAGDGAEAAARCLRRRASVSAPMLAFDAPAPRDSTPASVSELPLAGSALARARDLEGLGKAGRTALRRVAEATVLTLRPRPPGLGALAEGARLVLECARETGALVGDPATGEVFTAERWYARRVEGWSDGLPSVPSNVVVDRAPENGDELVLRTYGLSKFGLPELELSTTAGIEPAGRQVLEAAAQVMLESGRLARPGVLELDPSRIRHAGARAAFVATCGATPGSTARLLVRTLAPDRASDWPAELEWGASALAAVEPGARAAARSRRAELVAVTDAGEGVDPRREVAAVCPALAGRRADAVEPRVSTVAR